MDSDDQIFGVGASYALSLLEITIRYCRINFNLAV